MDERTLNDLLECSVCLERLDTSSKVLPCQHTFCRKCLEVIVSSHQELRCPECRILVDAKIDDLPPNVLLMRILEGMKNASQNQNNSKSPKSVHSNATQRSNEAVEISKQKCNEQYLVQISNNQNISNKRTVPHAFALYDFFSKDTGDLNFKKGDIIFLKRKLDASWFIGESNGREGPFPINYVQIIVPLPVPQCIALYDFKMGPSEEEGCLSFKKGTIIKVLRRVDQNWAEGRIGSSIGIFPIAFVEMNSLAKQLLEIGNSSTFSAPRGLPPVPFEKSLSDSSTTSTTSPNSTCSSNTSTNSIPSSPTSNCNSPQNQSSIKYRDLKEKRHSLNALTANTPLNIAQSNRHSAEILSVSEPAESDTYENNQGTSMEASQTIQQENRQQQNPSKQALRGNVLKSVGQQMAPNLPWVYVALYPYKPRKSDELELKKGCVYFVTERCLDGWFKGKNWADKSGVFPGNFVTPLKTRDQQKFLQQKATKQNSQSAQVTSNVSVSSPQSHIYSNNSGYPPPELPPRNGVNSSNSVWTKPLGQHVEAFFNRKSQQKENKSSNSSNGSARNSSKEECSQQREKDKKDLSSLSAVGLMKRLTNITRCKSPTQVASTAYSIDNPVFDDGGITSLLKQNTSISHPVHVRSGSCPSQLLQSLPVDLGNNCAASVEQQASPFGSQRVKGHKERTMQGLRQQAESNHTVSGIKQTQTQQITANNGIQHRKTQSLDANSMLSQVTGNSNGKAHTSQNRERFRCIVSYPPNSEVELELNVGDIVFVHRKQKNGWYKGTHAKTNKSGLFPASFVEPDI